VNYEEQQRAAQAATMRVVKRSIFWSVVGLVSLTVLLGGWFRVPAGYRGVVLRMGAVQYVADPGFHLKMPIIDRALDIEVRIRKEVVQSAASSKDLQVINSEIALNYAPVPSAVGDLYKELGERDRWEERAIDPVMKEVFKSVTALYEAEELIQKRAEVSQKIDEALRVKLEQYNFRVVDVNITDFDFSPEFNRAIEAKVTAEQEKLKADMDLQRIIVERDQKIATAQAEAEALRIQKEEITPELLRLRSIEVQREAVKVWNGQLPRVILGGETPFIPMMEIGEE
jgi:regulator of protease activity HflC (stomatin/prohibitin superfamily)